MGYSFRHLPTMLTFNLCRFDYNWTTQRRSKLNGRFDFPLVLDMEPYCEQQVEERIRREEEERDLRAAHYRSLKDQTQSKVADAEQPEVDLNQESLFVDDGSATKASENARTENSTEAAAVPDAAATADAPSEPATTGKRGKNKGGKQQQQQQQQGGQGGRGKRNNNKKKQQQQQAASNDDGDDDSSSNSDKKPLEPAKLWQPQVNAASSAIYDLLSVVIHSGGAYGGHYYAFIRDLYVCGSGGGGASTRRHPQYRCLKH